ncbi:MAG TPA: TetR/AcrR family transcriptional regulator [Anaerolineales bacterium]|nr:TetR/AcrR family transcriptional regulator [Anaerolineales bacterium]
MPKAFSDAERDHIRSRLHEAGAQLFAKQGLRKTTIDEIVRAAGISKGAFYRFYDTKEALCLDVLETIEAGLRSRVLTEALVPRWGARAGVARLLNAALTTWDAYPLLRSFSRADYDLLIRKLPPEKVEAHVANDRAFVKAFNARLRREGIRPKARPALVVNLIRSLFWVGLHRDELGERDYAETMAVLIDLVAGHIVGEAP